MTDSVAANVEQWTQTNAEFTDAAAERAWSRSEITWGVFKIPESAVGALGDVNGLDVVELGCGTAFFSSWLVRRGARPVAVDPTPAQLATARRMQEESGIVFPLVEAPGEAVPLPAASFDLALSDYGASLWADPYAWIPEAARLLRPAGRLIFLVNATILMLCMPDAEEPATNAMLRPYRGLHRLEWTSDQSVNFHLGYGDWIRLLRANGFDVENLIELYPAEGATATDFPYATNEWARQWPTEEVWIARKTR